VLQSDSIAVVVTSSMFPVESFSIQLLSTAARASAKGCRTFRRQRYSIAIVAALQIIVVLMIVALVHENVNRYTAERCSCADADRWNADDDAARLPDEMDMKWIELMSMLEDRDCAETFLGQYEKFCETALVPAGVGYRSVGLSVKRPTHSKNLYTQV